MANFDVTLGHSVSVLDRLHHAFENWKERRAKARVYNQTRNELRSLSMRDLADLGISAAEINGIAYRAAYGEPK